MAIKSYKKEGRTLWRVTVKCRDRSGRQISRARGNLASQSQARKLEVKLKAELLVMRDGCKRYRWEDWVKRCIKKMQLEFRESTLAGYEANLRKWVTPVFSGYWLDKITPYDVHGLIFKHIEGVSPCTRRSVLKQVRRIFNMAIEEGVLNRNPCLGIKVKVHESKKLVLNHTEIQNLLAEGKRLEHPFYEHWVLALLTGMRSGELQALRWSDVDFGNKIISVNKSWSKFGGVGPTKSTMNRIVPISNELERFLKELKLKTKSEYVLKRSRDWQRGYQAVILRQFCDQIGITPVKFHDLRATFITQLLLRGVPVAKVMAAVGHSQLKTTMYYVRLVGADIAGITDSLKIEIPTNTEMRNNVISIK